MKFIGNLLKMIRTFGWAVIVAYMIAWHNFYHPIEKYLLQGNSRITVVEQKNEEDEEL